MMLDFIMPVEAISLQELQLSSQFELVYSRVYPKNSPIDEPNGHRRINATVYVLMPALDYIAGVQLQYDYELNRSLRQMLGDYDKPRTKRTHALDIFLWRIKQENLGIIGRIYGASVYTIPDESCPRRIHPDNISAMILPPKFGTKQYVLPNLVYKKVYGLYYDDEIYKN